MALTKALPLDLSLPPLQYGHNNTIQGVGCQDGVKITDVIPVFDLIFFNLYGALDFWKSSIKILSINILGTLKQAT